MKKKKQTQSFNHKRKANIQGGLGGKLKVWIVACLKVGLPHGLFSHFLNVFSPLQFFVSPHFVSLSHLSVDTRMPQKQDYYKERKIIL